MNTDKYAEFARIGNFTISERDAKFLSAMGLCGESAEVAQITEARLQEHLAATAMATRNGVVADRLKKHLLHHKPLDRDELRKELGDVLWYFFHTLNTFDMTFEEVANANIRKLCNRYPDGYGHPDKWIDSSPRALSLGHISYKDDPDVPEYGGM